MNWQAPPLLQSWCWHSLNHQPPLQPQASGRLSRQLVALAPQAAGLPLLLARRPWRLQPGRPLHECLRPQTRLGSCPSSSSSAWAALQPPADGCQQRSLTRLDACLGWHLVQSWRQGQVCLPPPGRRQLVQPGAQGPAPRGTHCPAGMRRGQSCSAAVRAAAGRVHCVFAPTLGRMTLAALKSPAAYSGDILVAVSALICSLISVAAS